MHLTHMVATIMDMTNRTKLHNSMRKQTMVREIMPSLMNSGNVDVAEEHQRICQVQTVNGINQAKACWDRPQDREDLHRKPDRLTEVSHQIWVSDCQGKSRHS